MKKYFYCTTLILSVLLCGCGNVAEIPVETAPAVTAQPEEITPEPIPFLEETQPPVAATKKTENTAAPTSAPSVKPAMETEEFSVTENSTLQPALYLRTTPYSSRNDSEQIDYFLKAENSGVISAGTMADDPEATAEGIDSLLYAQPDGCGYLRLCAAVAGLVDSGTFADTEDAAEQYMYLTDVNGFSSVPLAECRELGGSHPVSKGDIIFFCDVSGNPVSAAVVTGVSNDYLTCVLRGWGETVARLEINSTMLKPETLANARLVNISYPGVEFRIYAFLTGEMGYSPAAACGVMANMYKESMFIAATGKSTYGLCQWQGDRLTAFLNWCYSKKYDSSTLIPQLLYFKKELTEGGFTELNDYLISLGNSEEDAFNAAKQFCIQYEKPSNAYALGNDRGDLAKEFYRIYCS